MARIPEYFNVGDRELLDTEGLLLMLERMYTDLAIAINTKPDVVQRDTDGDPADTFLAQGTFNINLTTDKVEMLTNHPTQTTVTWTTLS